MQMIILIAIIIGFLMTYNYYKKIDRRLDVLSLLEKELLESKFSGKKGVRKSFDGIESICSPLVLLNIFDKYKSLTSGEDVYLDWVILDFERAERERIRTLEELDEREKWELQTHERKTDSADTFIPSEILLHKIRDASAAIVIRHIQYDNLQALKQPFIDALNGKITIQQAQNIVNEKVEKVPYFGRIYERFYDDLRVKKEFEGLYGMLKERWEDGKWRDRLKWYRERNESASETQ